MAEKKYWVTRTNVDDKTDGHITNMTVTNVSFDDINAAAEYVKRLNDQHHQYMLRTQDASSLGLHHDFTTEKRIEEVKRIGVKVNDDRNPR